MRIGGLQKISAIDYPGRVGCVVFTVGCNFRCPYCHNPDLVRPSGPDFMSEDDFFAFLSERTHFLDGVSITGGEPCLHADLPDFCAKIKDMGFLVKLDTNGSLPQVTAGLIEKGLIDYIAMDVKTAPERYEPLTGPGIAPDTICRSIDLIKTSGLPCEFRTTCVRPFVDEAAICRIADLVAGAPLYVLQHCGKDRMLDPGFFKEDPVIGQGEMERFKDIAQNKVGRCIIR